MIRSDSPKLGMFDVHLIDVTVLHLLRAILFCGEENLP